MADLLAEADSLLSELTADGVLVRDLTEGIIDFPGRTESGPVLWCYRLGEDGIDYWHRPNEGFAGRKPVPPT